MHFPHPRCKCIFVFLIVELLLFQIRSAVAYTIAMIAGWDFPDDWPGIFDELMAAIASQDEHAVQGAVRVLKEFCRYSNTA